MYEDNSQELKKSLSLTDTTLLAIGNIIGAGVFVLFGIIIQKGKNNTVPILIIAMLLNLSAALCYAELGSMYKSNSTEYEAIRDAYGPATANISTIILLIFLVVTIAALTLMFGKFLSNDKNTQFYISIILITTVCLIIYTGIKTSKIITDVLGTTKISTLALLILLGLIHIIRNPPKFETVLPTAIPDFKNATFIYASFLAIFLFNGYDAVVKMTEEIKEPEKTIPRAIIISVVFCSISYITIAIIGLTLSIKSHRPINEILAVLIKSQITNALVYIIGFLAIFNTVFLSVLALSRFLYGLAKTSNSSLKIPHSPLFFQWLSQVNPKFKTPHNSIILVFILTSTLLLIGRFETSVILTNTCMLLFLFLLVSATIVLRITKPNLPRPFRVPLNINHIPIPAIACIVFIVLYLTQLPLICSQN